MFLIILSLLVDGLSLSAAQGEICSLCNCIFVNITKIEPKAGDFITFQYKADAVEPFNANVTYNSLKKYFHVDCSSESNVGQINNLDWPKLKVLGILANFRNSKWKKLEWFPSNIKKQMTVLSLSQNLIPEIEDFELYEFTNLKMLNLSQNHIAIIKKGIFSKLNLLKVIDLSGNWLTELENWAFYGTDLSYLNLSRNGIAYLNSDVFRGLYNLTILDLSENKLTKLPEEFGNFLPSLSWLSVKKNGLDRLPELPKQLKKFDVSHNHLMNMHLEHFNLEFLDIRNNEFVSLAHTKFPALKVLMAGHNNFSELHELQSTHIRILDLSYNKFNKIPKVVTSDKLPLLEELYLDGNPISNMSFPLQNEPFSYLKILGLSHLKRLKEILKHSFWGVIPKVQYDCSRESGIFIDLSFSSIKFIDEDAFKTVSVCRIDLSNNNLKSLSKDLLPWFQMSYINLQDNPWQCDCNIQWMLDDFLTFMYVNNSRLLFGMRCSTPVRFKNKLFVFWYNKTSNVFCKSGPSSFFLDIGGERKVEEYIPEETRRGFPKEEPVRKNNNGDIDVQSSRRVSETRFGHRRVNYNNNSWLLGLIAILFFLNLPEPFLMLLTTGSRFHPVVPSLAFTDTSHRIWTVSAVACVLLGCVILVTGVIIIVLLCTRPSKAKRRVSHQTPKTKTKGPPCYKQLQTNPDDVNKGYSEKCV